MQGRNAKYVSITDKTEGKNWEKLGRAVSIDCYDMLHDLTKSISGIIDDLVLHICDCLTKLIEYLDFYFVSKKDACIKIVDPEFF